MNILKQITKIGCGLAVMGAFATSAHAAPIVGGVNFGGSWAPSPGPGIVGATGVDITGDQASVTCALLSNCQDSYAALNPATFILATYNDFTFSPFPGTYAPLWTFDYDGKTYSFDLESINVDEQDANSLVLLGTGTLKITGFEDTAASFSFSGDKTATTFAFSSTASAVPEPGALSILGLGLLGMGLARRKKQVA